MSLIELSLYEISGFFLNPVLLAIITMFIYSFYTLGTFVVEAWQRLLARLHKRAPLQVLAIYRQKHPDCTLEELELHILKRLEPLRIVSRTAPMLGLIATMIPMGPALLSLADNQTKTVSENLVIAFSAVITALLAASITFAVLTVRRRWLLAELAQIKKSI